MPSCVIETRMKPLHHHNLRITIVTTAAPPHATAPLHHCASLHRCNTTGITNIHTIRCGGCSIPGGSVRGGGVLVLFTMVLQRCSGARCCSGVVAHSGAAVQWRGGGNCYAEVMVVKRFLVFWDE
ncbi:unnamed protein product [Lupinus luteus]|uniref:Uncharacterized protein n=1 Tax=Lupinus luteus TaxID=3873 RepID=A0AAV1WN89_LUPLU